MGDHEGSSILSEYMDFLSGKRNLGFVNAGGNEGNAASHYQKVLPALNGSTLADLVDKKVGVSSGSTSARALVAAMIEAGVIDGTDFDPDTFDAATWTTGVSFQQYDDYPTISIGLSAKEVDAFCVDKSILAIYNTDSRSYIEDEFAPQEYGVATTKDSGLSELVNTLVEGWLADGTIEGLIADNNLN